MQWFPMETLDLGALDMGLIVCYLLAVGLLGLWFSRGVKTGKDFFSRRTLPALVGSGTVSGRFRHRSKRHDRLGWGWISLRSGDDEF